jgi:hypothetical protein
MDSFLATPREGARLVEAGVCDDVDVDGVGFEVGAGAKS